MDNKFVEGLFVSRRENAPEFVLMDLSFKAEKFIDYLKNHTNANGYMNVQVKMSQAGKPYASLNKFEPEKFVKKDGKIAVEEIEPEIQAEMELMAERREIQVEDIPF